LARTPGLPSPEKAGKYLTIAGFVLLVIALFLKHFINAAAVIG